MSVAVEKQRNEISLFFITQVRSPKSVKFHPFSTPFFVSLFEPFSTHPKTGFATTPKMSKIAFPNPLFFFRQFPSENVFFTHFWAFPHRLFFTHFHTFFALWKRTSICVTKKGSKNVTFLSLLRVHKMTTFCAKLVISNKGIRRGKKKYSPRRPCSGWKTTKTVKNPEAA